MIGWFAVNPDPVTATAFPLMIEFGETLMVNGVVGVVAAA